MTSAYMAICYSCNEKCRFCPYAKEPFNGNRIPLDELKKTASNLIWHQGIDMITISGGEPTLHPELWDFIAFLTEQNIFIVLLTNGERFASELYIGQISEKIRFKDKITIITTLHSHHTEIHEKANQTPGSLERTLKGLHNIMALGIHIIVKHCITRENYRELESFYEFIDHEFLESADIQLCSIDYCGMNHEEAIKEKLTFPALKPYLELMFDKHLRRMGQGSKRLLYCIHMPLCSSDPYYWQFYIPRSNENYTSYAKPDKNDKSIIKNHVDEEVYPASPICTGCAVYELCPGTYKSAFALFSDDLVKPYFPENPSGTIGRS